MAYHSAPSPHRARSLTVLIVDDEPLLRWSIAQLLRVDGHTVFEAVTATEARRILRKTSVAIDLALLDYRLPDARDWRLLEDVRRHHPHGTVVLMTAFSTPTLIQGAIDRGAYCVLTKPFDLRHVNVLIAHVNERTHRS